MKEIQCGFCDKLKILTNKKYKKGLKEGNKHFFCDRKCYEKYQTKIGTKIISCAYCGKKVRKEKSDLARAKQSFCSNPCKGKGILRKPKEIHTITCPICKKKQTLSLGQIYKKKTPYCADCWNKYLLYTPAFNINAKEAIDLNLLDSLKTYKLYSQYRKLKKEVFKHETYPN